MDSQNPMGMGTIDEHIMGMGRRFMEIEMKVLEMGNRFP
jgi:hypothetical protein